MEKDYQNPLTVKPYKAQTGGSAIFNLEELYTMTTKPHWFSVIVRTTQGRAYRGRVYANSQHVACLGARAWASTNGHTVGSVSAVAALYAI
jgi:hypothetical protein